MEYRGIIRNSNWTICCLLLYFFIGCENNQSVNLNLPVIDLKQDRDTVNLQLNEIAKRIQYIELESIHESFIGEINDIVFSDHFIAILDQKQQKVFLFNSSGKFVRIIGRRGKGPQE